MIVGGRYPQENPDLAQIIGQSTTMVGRDISVAFALPPGLEVVYCMDAGQGAPCGIRTGGNVQESANSRAHQESGSVHTFHIPVMGTGFTIDTPLRVAKYGFSSVISLVDDALIEQMRRFHCEKEREPYEKISDHDENARSRRITSYLNLMDRFVQRQVSALQASPFEPGSDITHYYEMLPETPLKQTYKKMLAATDPEERARMQNDLRHLAVPGSIDVNIMTKLDRPQYRDGRRLPVEFNDAMSALRGYAESTLSSSIVFSAGMNPHLYGYLTQFEDFFPDRSGLFRKRIILKVSDYRSALVQGKFLAKRGLWVSEYRIESGLNCGGHAFATKGLLMGLILREFREKRNELQETIRAIYTKACIARDCAPSNSILETKITVQGGIGTAVENAFLMQYYEVDGTGWATPFLLAPDVVNMDDAHLDKLCRATAEDVYLSDSSPMGIPYWNLRNSASEETRRQYIREGKPGSPCPKRYAALDTEFTKVPICTAGRSYQKRKLQRLQEEGHSRERLSMLQKKVQEKSCICHDLGGTTMLKHGIDPDATPTICCGINITYFSKITSLEEMVSHIYGRLSLLADSDRPHMFIQELQIYIEHLRKEIEDVSVGLTARTDKYFSEFKGNLLRGIDYYRTRVKELVGDQRERFAADLEALYGELKSILPVPLAVSSGGTIPG